jgi:hypothetical protein
MNPESTKNDKNKNNRNTQVQMLYGRQTGEKDAVPTSIGTFLRVCAGS